MSIRNAPRLGNTGSERVRSRARRYVGPSPTAQRRSGPPPSHAVHFKLGRSKQAKTYFTSCRSPPLPSCSPRHPPRTPPLPPSLPSDTNISQSMVPLGWRSGLKIGRAQRCPFSGHFVERLGEIRLWRNYQPPFSVEGPLDLQHAGSLPKDRRLPSMTKSRDNGNRQSGRRRRFSRLQPHPSSREQG